MTGRIRVQLRSGGEVQFHFDTHGNGLTKKEQALITHLIVSADEYEKVKHD